MKLVDLTVKQFIDEVDSKSPAPGGGSVAALATSVGIALSKMVGHLTINRKSFKALDEENQTRFIKALDRLAEYKQVVNDLIDKDTEAFNQVMAAFQLPKISEEQKAFRNAQIEQATLEAIHVPYQLSELSLKAMKQLDVIAELGNPNCLSDVGVSALMISSGCIGALLNVKINLPGVSDKEKVQYYTDYNNELIKKISEHRDYLVSTIYLKL
jgi:formiminotetrahydrofolate cyclodeaminase